ncbi:MAG: hypothetical protein IT270_15965 [Saprospiraceae bacterium]|nr:hypothetical protein [Saprospiraceae bacterium]
MQNVDNILLAMTELSNAWERKGDRRFIFLRCYGLMSTNMANAIRDDRFADPPWVKTLMLGFAHYYFEALEKYNRLPEQAPAAWRQVFDASQKPGVHVLQNLLLGVNAHINYDLPLALYDCLHHDWPLFDETKRKIRKDDHEAVNQIICDTIDMVQDTVVEPLSPAMSVVDRLMGRMDEWLLSQLITGWRHDVWHVTQTLLEAPDEAGRETIRQDQERRVLERAESLIAAY